MQISQRISNLLNQRGIKNSVFADSIGVKRQTVQSWIDRNSDPSAKHIAAIADFFGVSTDYILTGIDRQPTLSEDLVKIVNLWGELNDDNRAIVKGRMLELVREQRLEERVSGAK